jgi:hypothetical protein
MLQVQPSTYQCADCDFAIGLTDGAEPIESFEGVAGKPIHRVVTIGGVEVHRCASVCLTTTSPIDNLVM